MTRLSAGLLATLTVIALFGFITLMVVVPQWIAAYIILTMVAAFMAVVVWVWAFDIFY